MFQSSPSTSSSQKSTVAAGESGGLIRYGSAPGSLFASAVDSVIGSASREELSALGSNLLRNHQYFSADSSSSSSKSESTCKISSSYDPKASGLQRSYGLNEISQRSNGGSAGTGSSYSLARQRSSPAGFFSHLSADQSGFSITRGNDNYSPQGCSNVGRGVSRLKTQLSFSGQDPLAQISEGNESVLNGDMGMRGSGSQSYNAGSSSFAGMDLWEASNSIGFTTTQPNKRAKNADGNYFAHLDSLENQFSMTQTSLEMGGVDGFLHLPEDTVPCKMRAKRGFATHPRSIAERERRTRISGKLKKLQELVPNMDKQTSYSDMLDLAVQHIKGLQNQVQKLQKEQENCICGCKQST